MPAESDLVIGTDRLELRPIRRDDAQVLFPVLSDPGLYEYTGGTPPASVDVLSDFYASRETRRSPAGTELWFNWTIRRRDSGVAVGYVQASVATAGTDVAWVVGSQWQGSGYASEAAKAVVEWLRGLGVTRIRARIHPHHVASQKVAINIGLQRTSEISEGEEVWILGAG